jgi:lipopolysaccharide transport system ATP-binding protein
MFQHRCIRKIREIQERGKTILFVSHDINTVKSICSQAVFLDGGRVVSVGDAQQVTSEYHAHVAMLESSRADLSRPVVAERTAPTAQRVRFTPDPAFESRASLFRHGSGEARVRNVELLDGRERPVSTAAFDEEVVLRVHVEFIEDVEYCIVGFFFRDRTGTDLVGTNSHEEGKRLPSRRAGETLVVDFRQRVPLGRGTYSVTVGIGHHRSAPGYLDWVDNALVFEVLPASGKLIHSKVWLPAEIEIHG